jgi:hypothetical protein
MAEGR